VAARALALAVMAVLGWQILQRDLDFTAGLRFLHGIDLVIHEAGHAFALVLPRFFSVLGGSALQVLLPAVCALIFLHQGQLASFAVASFWMGESITDVAIYMADARAQALPLIGGHAAVHDWNYLLGQLHLLGWTQSLARLTLSAGILLIVVAPRHCGQRDVPGPGSGPRGRSRRSRSDGHHRYLVGSEPARHLGPGLWLAPLPRAHRLRGHHHVGHAVAHHRLHEARQVRLRGAQLCQQFLCLHGLTLLCP